MPRRRRDDNVEDEPRVPPARRVVEVDDRKFNTEQKGDVPDERKMSVETDPDDVSTDPDDVSTDDEYLLANGSGYMSNDYIRNYRVSDTDEERNAQARRQLLNGLFNVDANTYEAYRSRQDAEMAEYSIEDESELDFGERMWTLANRIDPVNPDMVMDVINNLPADPNEPEFSMRNGLVDLYHDRDAGRRQNELWVRKFEAPARERRRQFAANFLAARDEANRRQRDWEDREHTRMAREAYSARRRLEAEREENEANERRRLHAERVEYNEMERQAMINLQREIYEFPEHFGLSNLD